MVVVYLVIFWLMQAAAQVLFKYGTVLPGKHTLFFILGNVPGASSILLLMQLYKIMNPNLALALGTGGGFLACQIALAIIFRSSLSVPQYASMAAIGAGMFGFTFFNKS